MTKSKRTRALQSLCRCSLDDLKPLRLCGICGREDSMSHGIYPWEQNQRLGSESLTHGPSQAFHIQSITLPQRCVRLQCQGLESPASDIHWSYEDSKHICNITGHMTWEYIASEWNILCLGMGMLGWRMHTWSIGPCYSKMAGRQNVWTSVWADFGSDCIWHWRLKKNSIVIWVGFILLWDQEKIYLLLQVKFYSVHWKCVCIYI